MTAAERLSILAQEAERLTQRRWDNARKAMWAAADKTFPTDYAEDAQSSAAAGYPASRSTADGHFYHYICDLGPTLELNMGARTVRLNIDSFFSPDDTAAVNAEIAACNAAVRELATI